MKPVAIRPHSPPPEFGLDWNNASQQSLAFLLGLVPTAGPLLSTLLFIFWPPGDTDVWAEVEDQVKRTIHKELSTLVSAEVTASLQGLHANVSSYAVALRGASDTPLFVSEKWNVANGCFLQQLPMFQLKGYESALLPLFAQFANLHLALLRDGVLCGAQWGWSPAVIGQIQSDLVKAIRDYMNYARDTIDKGLKEAWQTPTDARACQPFKAANAFTREMTLTVTDYMIMWPYFDAGKYPNGVTIINEREIYTDPQGSFSSAGQIALPLNIATQPIQQITVWGWDRIDALQVVYPPNGGPNGITTTPRMGDDKGGANTPPHGGVFQVFNNPVVKVSGASGDILNALELTFADKTSSGRLGGAYPGGDPFAWEFPEEVLTSVYVNGYSGHYGSAECALFGFRFKPESELSDPVRRILYVTAIKDAGSFGPAQPGWDEARTAFWDDLARQQA